MFVRRSLSRVTLSISMTLLAAGHAWAANIAVRANSPVAVPGRPTLVRVALVDEKGAEVPTGTPVILNITVTTLGDLALAKKMWAQEELRRRQIFLNWPPLERAPNLPPIATEADLRVWRLPEELHRSLWKQLERPGRGEVTLPFGRTAEFFLARLENGESHYDFAFTPAFSAGTFFIFAEIKGIPVGSTVIRSPRGARIPLSAAWAANNPVQKRLSVTIEPAGKGDSQQPPKRRFKYLFRLTTERPLTHDCEFDLVVERGPMVFLDGRTTRTVWIPEGLQSSLSVHLINLANADLREQQFVRIRAIPRGRQDLSGAVYSFAVPPRFVSRVDWPAVLAEVPGNGRIPLQLAAEVRDELGNVPTPRDYGYSSATMTLRVASSGPGLLREVVDVVKPISATEPARASWSINGIGDCQVTTTVNVRAGDLNFKSSVDEAPRWRFYFPYSLLLIPLVSLIPAWVRKSGRGLLALASAYVVVLGGFFGAITEYTVARDLKLSLGELPLWFWPIALCLSLVVAIGIEAVAPAVAAAGGAVAPLGRLGAAIARLFRRAKA